MIRLRNSMLNDWEEMCQLAFKARWFGSPEEKELMDIGFKQNIRWGSFFEQLTLGAGVGGRMIDLSDKEKQSEHYIRVKRQAKEARNFLFKELGFPFLQAQVQVFGSFNVEGFNIPVEGNIDAAFGTDHIQIVLDTKYTGDTTNTYGKYSWGKPETMDMGQLIMYSELSQQMYPNHPMPRTIYYVADSSPKERVEVIEPLFSSYAREEYKWRVFTAYKEISQHYNFNYWTPQPDYNKCKQCPLRENCSSAIKSPQIKTIQK
jgi:hypothetical protein